MLFHKVHESRLSDTCSSDDSELPGWVVPIGMTSLLQWLRCIIFRIILFLFRLFSSRIFDYSLGREALFLNLVFLDCLFRLSCGMA